MARGLTNRQREVLTHIRAALERTGRPPTLRELGARLGIRSTNGVRDHLKALVAKGYLARDPHSARGLRLLQATATRRAGAGRAARAAARWRRRRAAALCRSGIG